MAFNKVSIAVAGAASATLATAVSNTNTAVATAITAALAVTNVSPGSVVATAPCIVHDGTNYVVLSGVQYTVTS